MNYKKGLTLIEIIVVIGIIGILAATVVVVANAAKQKSRIARIQSAVGQIKIQLESDVVEYPDLDYRKISDNYDSSKLTPIFCQSYFWVDYCADPVINSDYQGLIDDAERHGASRWVMYLIKGKYLVAAQEPNSRWYCVDGYGAALERADQPGGDSLNPEISC